VNDIFYIVIFLGILLLLAIPLGGYMASVFTGRRTLMSFLLRPIELGIYRLCKVDESQEMSWKEY
jgi:K+-transporting ATPase ATPase A chain